MGKTTLVEMFSKEYEQFIKLNLEKPRDRALFEKGGTAKDVYNSLLIRENFSSGKRTLLFIDEIQHAPPAISLLRYFYEDLPGLHVVAAGSLLEIILQKERISFPVGRVEYLNIYPLTFYEYLKASGNTQMLDAFEEIPAREYALPILFEKFHQYVLLGGMPEVVSQYLQHDDMSLCNAVYQSLLVAYQDDISKYAKDKSEAQVIRHCLETAPYEAAARIKFANFGNSNYKSRDIGNAFRILERAMLIKLIYPSTAVSIPALPDFKKHPKLQFLDTGLVNYFAGLQQYYFPLADLQSVYKGKIAEHIVLQELIAKTGDSLHKPCFWVRESKNSNAELDGLFTYKGALIPIEVKSCVSGRLKSLHLFMDQAQSNTAVRFSAASFRKETISLASGKSYTLLNIPYFHASRLEQYLDASNQIQPHRFQNPRRRV